MAPTIVDGGGVGEVNKGAPARALRLLEQLHFCFVRQAVPFPRVAGDAGADHVFPRRVASALAGHDVIEVQFLPVEAAGAVLTGVVVALVDVLSREFHLLAGQAVEKAQDNNGGHPDIEADGMDDFVAGLTLGEVVPAREVVGQIIGLFVAPDDVGMVLIEQREGAPNAADIDGLPQSVEH